MKDFISLAVQLKRQMNDIIDVAYQNKSPSVRGQLKRFSLFCTDATKKTFLGDCRFNPKDKTSQIRIFALGDEGFKEILITTMHEVSHHIDHSLRGTSGHDAPFYLAHKKLLFAAMDMGIITKEDVVHSDSKARNRQKLAKMMEDYQPNPVPYKQGTVQIYVYDAYFVKDSLKARGYKWNALDAAWVLETNDTSADGEKDFLLSLGLQESNIKTIKSSAVVVRLRKNVRLYNVPFENNQIVKELGYHWVNAGKTKYWEKKIDEEVLPPSEIAILENISGIKIVIT